MRILKLGGVVAALLVAALAVTACGSSSTDAAAKTGPLHGKLIWYVGVSDANSSEYAIAQGIAHVVRKQGGTFVRSTAINPTTGALDVATQVQAFQQALAAKPAAIIYFDITPAEAQPQVKAARAAGIPVFAVEGTPAKGIAVNGWIDNDNFAQGRILGNYLSAHLKKGSQVTVIASIAGAPVTSEEIDGAVSAFRARGMDFVGSVNDQRNDLDNATGGQNVMREILAKYPRVQGVLAYNDDSVVGAIAAANAARDTAGKKILFVSRNGESQAVPLVKNGELLATCDLNPIGMGEDAATSAINQILGKKNYSGAEAIPPPQESCLVDKSNVARYKEWDQRIPYLHLTER